MRRLFTCNLVQIMQIKLCSQNTGSAPEIQHDRDIVPNSYEAIHLFTFIDKKANFRHQRCNLLPKTQAHVDGLLSVSGGAIIVFSLDINVRSVKATSLTLTANYYAMIAKKHDFADVLINCKDTAFARSEPSLVLDVDPIKCISNKVFYFFFRINLNQSRISTA